jgi:hypothetical protein
VSNKESVELLMVEQMEREYQEAVMSMIAWLDDWVLKQPLACDGEQFKEAMRNLTYVE